MAKSDLTAQRLRELLHYDPDTGYLAWGVYRNQHAKVGDIAGSVGLDGYVRIKVNGILYLAHRLMWLYVHGTWPVSHLDHINGTKSDNRMVNLREATRTLNNQNLRTAQSNSRSGFLGTVWRKDRNKWSARIKLDGKERHLGYFNTPEAAHAAYLEAKRRLHPGCTI